jgi:hypothetical protein
MLGNYRKRRRSLEHRASSASLCAAEVGGPPPRTAALIGTSAYNRSSQERWNHNVNLRNDFLWNRHVCAIVFGVNYSFPVDDSYFSLPGISIVADQVARSRS